MNLPIVAIVGRVNVGKSTLFNCLLGQSKAIISKIPGTTRDRNYGQASWRGQEFILVDTGGIASIKNLELNIKEAIKKITLEKAIQQQIAIALGEANLILLVVDIKDGLLPQDRIFALTLRKLGKPIILVANKVDRPDLREEAQSFLKLGLGEPQTVSAISGAGIGDLLDKIIETLKFKHQTQKTKFKPLTLAIIGKPNVGKSSLLNALLGQERVIVNEIPFTTREPQDTLINYRGERILLIDTAGIRKKSKIKAGIERKGVTKSLKRLQEADICLFVTEVHLSLTTQDSHLGRFIQRAGTGVIIVANKWDLVFEKDKATQKKYIDYYHHFIPQLAFAPIVFVSALEKIGVKKILDLTSKVKNEREKIIPTETLTEFFKRQTQAHKLPRERGQKTAHLYDLKQTRTSPPEFTLILQQKTKTHPAYLKFLENRLREEFGFLGTSIRVKIRTI